MVWMGREVRSRTDYIMGMDLRIFSKMSVRDPRHNSDYYMIFGCLHIATLRDNTKYLGRLTRVPFRPPTASIIEECLFSDLQQAIPNPKARESDKNS